MARSADGAGVTVTVDVLLVGLGSVVPAGGVTVAVFTRLPVSDANAVPVTVKTTELPAPAAMFTVDARLLPLPVAVVLDVQVTPVSNAEIVSATLAPVTLLGPTSVTVIV